MVGIMIGGPGQPTESARAPPRALPNVKGGALMRAAMQAGRSRTDTRAVAKQVEQQAAESNRLAALQLLDGLAQGDVSFEDMWHTAEFQKRMLALCRRLYGDADAQSKFNLLNDVRNDLTSDGKAALETLFKNYSMLGGDRGKLSGQGNRAITMDLGELKACLVDLGCFPSAKKGRELARGPRMLTADAMSTIFEAVNDQMEGLDDDAHEFSFEEFYVAMCMVAVYCNKPMEAIVFPGSMGTESLEDVQNNRPRPDAKESSASRMSSLIKQEHMRIIEEMFTDCHGEMTVDQFVDSLGSLMGMSHNEAETMFFKIDYNGDGGITWSEFSNFILALGERKESKDSEVLECLVNPNVPIECLHKATISAAAIVPANQWRPGADKYVTFSTDGPINVWAGAQGNPLKQDTPFSLKGAATYVLSACAMVMYNVVLVSSNDERVRFYSFEPRFKQDLEYDCEESVAHCMHCFAAKLGPDQSWLSWFVWGDNLGRVHLVPEAALAEYRAQSTATHVATIKGSTVKLQHTSGLKWQAVGTTRPDKGRHIQNSRLAEALEAKQGFTQSEWDAFGIAQLGIDDFIKSGEKYFQPDQRADKAYTRSLFTGFVTAIQYVADAGPHGRLVMCSNDANVLLFDPDNRLVTHRFQGHSLAVKCLAWVRNYRSIASSGLDRDILLWDPNTGNRTGRYRGHKAPVLGLCYFDRTEMLFSLDLKYQLYVWDTSKQLLLGQIDTDAGDPFVTKHRQRSQLMLINELRGHLVLCGKRPYVWKIREEEKKADGAVLHDTGLIAAIYNDLFSQIITVDYSGLVGIWEIHNGQQCFAFRINQKFADGSHVSISAAILDPIKRCVAIGFTNGKIVTYNTQNGSAVNEFITAENAALRSTQPITSLHFSESEDGRENDTAHAQLFATGIHVTGASCVWQWRTPFDTENYSILVSKVMLLPNWRDDLAIDYTQAIYFHADLIACGRIDGRVIIWNGHTGFLKKELDQIFWAMDMNNDGELTRDEVWTFLRDREGYEEEEFEDFWKICDIDGSGTISKSEFQLALSKRGTVARIDGTTGKLLTERLGSHLVFLKFLERLTHVILMVTADGWVMFTNWQNGQLLFLMNLNPQEAKTEIDDNDKGQSLVTCCAMDGRESTLIVGSSCGHTKLWDISRVSEKSQAKDKIAKLLCNCKDSKCDEVTAVGFIQRHNIVLICGTSMDGKTLPSISVWDVGGNRLGQLGGEDGWVLNVSGQDIMLRKLQYAAEAKIQQQKVEEDPENALMGDPDLVKILANQLHNQRDGNKKMLQFRNTEMVQKEGLLKGSVIAMLNRNHFKLKALSHRELQVRLQRAKLFLETRMPESSRLHAKTLEDLEASWRTELAQYSLSAFTHPKQIPSGLSTEEKELLAALDKEDKAQLLVKQFVLASKHTIFTLPPSDALTERVVQYVRSQWWAGNQKRSGSPKTPPSSDAITMSHEDSHAPWFQPSVIRSFLITQVLNVHILQGNASVNDIVADEEKLPLDVQTRVFRAQHGWDPRWQPIDTAETTKRTFRVAGEVKNILGRKDILASSKRDWVSRFVDNEPDRILLPPVGEIETPTTVLLGSGVGAVHHHLIGPISMRRCSARGPTGVAELECRMPYPGDPAPDTAKWGDVYMPKLEQPFKLVPASIKRESMLSDSTIDVDEDATDDACASAESSSADRNPMGKIGRQDKASKEGLAPRFKQTKSLAKGFAGRKATNVHPSSMDSMVERLTSTFELEAGKPPGWEQHPAMLEVDTVEEKPQANLQKQPTVGRDHIAADREGFGRAPNNRTKAEKALDALKNLNKPSLSELKKLVNPPPGVQDVTDAILALKGVPQEKRGWVAAKSMMRDVNRFLENDLKDLRRLIDDRELPSKNVQDAKAYLELEHVKDPSIMARKSDAAASLCDFLLNIISYYDSVAARPLYVGDKVGDKSPEAMSPCRPGAESGAAAQGGSGANGTTQGMSPLPGGRLPHSPTQPRLSPAQPKFREQRLQRQASENRPAQVEFASPDATATEGKPPRVWHCKWADTPSLSEHLLPAIPNTGPPDVASSHTLQSAASPAHTVLPVSRVPSARAEHAEGPHRKAGLRALLWVGVGDSPKNAHWNQRTLSFDSNALYIHMPIVDENGHSLPGSEKIVVCHFAHDTTIGRVEDDFGSSGRCGALLLEWGPKDQRLRIFIAARESTDVIEWLIGMKNVIDVLKEEFIELAEQKMRIFESRKHARATLRLIRKAEDLDLKAEKEAREVALIRRQHLGMAERVSFETAPPTARSETATTSNTTNEPSRASSAPGGNAAPSNVEEEGQTAEQFRQPSPGGSDIPHTPGLPSGS